MSATVNIAGGISARSGVMYALYGRGEQYVEHMKNGTNRAVAYASSMGSPEEFIACRGDSRRPRPQVRDLQPRARR